MPIKVTCQCGKSFAAKDELAGKAVKCPNCQQPLRIPLAQSAAPLPSRAASPSSSSGSSVLVGSGRPPGPSESMFDDVGLKQAPAGAVMCPGCASPMTPGTVVCIKCGYNAKLGRRMETVKMGAGGGPGGHDAGSAELMNRAAATIEEDKEEERKKTREGMPWWVYLIGLMFVGGFVIMMMVLPQQQAMTAAGITLISLGMLASTYFQIRLVMIAFSESALQGVLYLFVPFYALIYIITRWDRCGTYFLLNFATGFIVSGGIMAIMLASWFADANANGGRLVPRQEQSVAFVVV